MKKASAASLDLVQLANDSEHPVCKLMDYGKHLFDKKKQKSASKKLDVKVAESGFNNGWLWQLPLEISPEDS